MMLLRQSLPYFTRRVKSACRYLSVNHEYVVKSRVNLNIPQVSLYNLMMDTMAKHPPGDIAFTDPVNNEELTYGELIRRSLQFSTVLRKQGFKKNDVLALMSPNCVDYFPAVFGTLACQGAVSTLNPNYTPAEILYQLKDCGAKTLIVDEKNLSKALEVAENCDIKDIFVFGGNPKKECGITPWTNVLTEPTIETFEQVDVKQDDVLFLPYSSGTTGLPKGVMLTNDNMVTNIYQAAPFLDNIPHNNTLAAMPFFHIYGLAIIGLPRLFRGSKVVTLPAFSPQTFLSAIQEHKVQAINVVPPLLLFLLNDPTVDDYDLSSLTELTSAAAPCSQDVCKRVQTKFPSLVMRQGYGMTETSPLITVQLKEEVVHGSVGRLVPNTEAIVVHTESGMSLPHGEVGEIWLRGPQVMKGYLNRPDETSNCLKEDGWLRTGDLGYFDEEHNFFIVDRLKELIKYKAYQVPPAELEGVLVSHPSVVEAAVVGIPDELAGELPKGFVKVNGEVTEDEIQQFVAERVSPHKKLRGGVEFVDDIPKTPSGKLLRRMLVK